MAVKKKVVKVTRFGFASNEEDVTIEFSDREFRVQGSCIGGPIIYAIDDKLAPTIPLGAKLLVNVSVTSVDQDGCYVFLKDAPDSFDIAMVELRDDGTIRYTSDKEFPQILPDLSGKELVGQVWEAQVLTMIEDLGTANAELPLTPKALRPMVQVWFPLWTDATPNWAPIPIGEA